MVRRILPCDGREEAHVGLGELASAGSDEVVAVGEELVEPVVRFEEGASMAFVDLLLGGEARLVC